MKLEFISFKLCPFTHMSLILCVKNHIPFDVSYINPANIPGWLKDISPNEEVPVLKVDTDTVIFESSVIMAFINDISDNNLEPKEAKAKAFNRAWQSFAGSFFKELFTITTTKKQTDFDLSKKNMLAKLDKVAHIKSENRFFNDDNFSLVDVAYAPFFLRLDLLNSWTNNALSIKHLEKITAWQKNILAEDFVLDATPKGLEDIYLANIEQRDGIFAKLLSNE